MQRKLSLIRQNRLIPSKLLRIELTHRAAQNVDAYEMKLIGKFCS